MNRFESLFSAYLLTLAACGDRTDREKLCEDASKYEGDLDRGDILLDVGFLAVEVGADCPAVEDVTELYNENCCPPFRFTGTACRAVGRVEQQITYTNYGYYDPYSGTTGEVSDVCLYEGVFKIGDGCCGRPLLHEGAPMVARLARTALWEGGDRPNVENLSARERKERGEHWLRAALLEHASVASFARFTLELLRWGAPPDLVARAQRAALDEVEHARGCFALAGAYLGPPLGPGEMDLGDAVALSPTLAAFAEAVAREGCVGETLSALDAASQLQREADPAVCRVLQQILTDEARHAGLAWETLGWILRRDPSLVSQLEQVFAEERARSAELSSGGWEQVIAPAWASLAA